MVVGDLDVYCIFGDVAVAGSVLSPTQMICVSPESDTASVIPLTFSLGVVPLPFGFEFTYVGAMEVLSVNRWLASTDSDNLGITVYGRYFRDVDTLACSIATNTVNAVFISSQIVECRFDTAHPFMILEAFDIEIWAAETGLLVYNGTVNSVQGPIISNITTKCGDSSLVHVHSDNMPFAVIAPDILFDWKCIVSGVASSAVVLNATTVVCDLSTQLVESSLSSLYLVDQVNMVWSAPFLLADIEDISCEQILMADTIAAPFSIEASSSFTHNLNWFKGKSTTQWRYDALQNSSVETVESIVNAYADSVHIITENNLHDNYAMDTTHCFIDGKVECFESWSVDLQKREKITNEISEIDTVDVDIQGRYQQHRRLFIDSVSSHLIDPANGSWVIVTGRTYSNSTTCSVGESGSVETVFFSTSSLQCFLSPSVGVALNGPIVLKLTDEVDGMESTNAVELYYDLFAMQLKQESRHKQPVMSTITSTTPALSDMLHVGGTWCASPEGCGGGMNISEWEVDPLGRAFGESQGGPISKLFSLDWSSRDNVTDACANETDYCEDTKPIYSEVTSRQVTEKVPDVGEVLLMDPSLVDYNSTLPYLHFFGTYFPDDVPWCCVIENTSSQCATHSFNEVRCSVYLDLVPGEYLVNLLYDCDSVVASMDLVVTTQSDELFVGAVSPPLFPRVNRMSPTSGSTAGGTLILFEGEDLEGITACEFLPVLSQATGRPNRLVVPVLNTSTSVAYCVSPAFAFAGPMQVSLFSGNVTYSALNGQYNVFDIPVIEMSYLSDDSTAYVHHINVISSFISTLLRVTCSVHFSDNSSRVIPGRQYGATTICSDFTFWSNEVVAVSISCNGQDYLDAKFSSPPRDKLSLSHLDVNSDGNLYTQFVNHSADITSMATSQQLDLMATSFRNVLCDGTQTLSMTVSKVTAADELYCSYGAHGIILPASLVSINTVTCVIPSMEPGMSVVTLSRAGGNGVVDVMKTEIYCSLQPNVITGYLQSRIAGGAHEIVFEGLHLLPSLSLSCALNGEIVRSTVTSGRSMVCRFAATNPGVKHISIHHGPTPLFQMTTCMSDILLRDGGILRPTLATSSFDCATESSAALDSTLVAAAQSRRGWVRDVKSYFPRLGSTFGGSPVEIIADEMSVYNSYRCSFGPVVVPAFVISENRLYCNSPPTQPSTTLLVVNASNGDAWIVGNFVFVNHIKIRNISTSSASRPGDVTVRVSVADLSGIRNVSAELYCHIGDEVVIAHISGDESVTCVSYFSAAAVTVALSIGSVNEVWSNVVQLTLGEYIYDRVSFSPLFGTSEGGTPVNVTLPNQIIGGPYNTIMCRFNGIAATVVSAMRIGDSVIVTCLSPRGLEGRVPFVVEMPDDESSTSFNTLASSVFSFERQATVVRALPDSILQGLGRGNSVTYERVYLQGINFKDSAYLRCIVNGTVNLPGRWHSPDTMSCDIPVHLTLESYPLDIRVSNNGLDLSHTAVTIAVTPSHVVTNISPLVGYASGGAVIQVSLLPDPHGMSLFCVFDSESVRAYRDGTGEYFCTAPSHAPGKSNLVIVVGGGVVDTLEFTYMAVPVVDSVYPPVVISTFETEVVLNGTGFSAQTIGIFRQITGAVASGQCVYYSQTSLRCRVTPRKGDRNIFMDVSSNGIDFITDFTSIQVLDATAIVSMEMPPVYNTGGATVSLTVTNLHSLDSLMCLFTTSAGMVLRRSVSFVSDQEVTCLVPVLPVGDATFQVTQYQHQLFGPVEFAVYCEPSVLSIVPLRVQSGTVTQLSVTFSASGGIPHDMDCIVDGGRYPVRLLSSYSGVCNIQPMMSGVFSVSVGHSYTLNASTVVQAELVVTDISEDISLNSTAILNFGHTSVLFKSRSCTLPVGTECMQDGKSRLPVHFSKPNDDAQMYCELICVYPPEHSYHRNRTVLALFLRGFEDSPYFTQTVALHKAVVLTAMYPSSGHTLGGTLINIYGSGFEDDGTLQCGFGDILVPAIFSSISRITCYSPPAPPGGVRLNLLRAGHVISKSNMEFSFVLPLPIRSINLESVYSLGGSLLIIDVGSMENMYDYQCKFTDVIVNAAPLNSTTLRCVSPALSYTTTTFSLVSDGVEKSSPIELLITQPPTVVLMEPHAVPAGLPAVFTVILSDTLFVTNADSVGCAVGSHMGLAKVEGATVECTIPDSGIPVGRHHLTVTLLGVEFYTIEVIGRSPIVVNRVSPLVGFTSQATAMVVQTVAPISDRAFSRCCFLLDDDSEPLLSQALVVGPNQWECLTPAIIGNSSLTAEIGVAGPDGVCESTAFSFGFVPLPTVLSVSPTFGKLTGGTAVVIELSKAISMERKMYCRIGKDMFLGERDDDYSVTCITRASPATTYPVELSVNGVDFVSIGFNFQYSLLSDDSEESADSISDVSPFIYRMSPTTVSSSRPELIRFFGTGFVRGSYCMMDSAFVLESIYVSASEIHCMSPVRVPGYALISIADPESGLVSDSMELLFQSDMSRLAFSVAGSASPSHGPRTGGTVITISGSGFSGRDKNLLCQIGSDWVFASVLSDDLIKCVTPANSYSGKVNVRVATADNEFAPGLAQFEYIEDPLIFDAQPHYGTVGTLIQIMGKGFVRNTELECMLGDVVAETVVVSDKIVTCLVPRIATGIYSVTLRTNGQQIVKSGIAFDNMQQVVLDSLSPVNGPALRGHTMLTIHGSGFPTVTDMYCVLGEDLQYIPATVLSQDTIRCRMPSHRPGRVNITVVAEGTRLHAEDNFLEFVFTPDVSVDKITPEFGYTSGGYPVFVFGSNFINTTFLGCRFGDMLSRGIFLSNTTIVCLAPSPLGRSELASKSVNVEVTVNGVDFSESRIAFDYSEPCDEGWFCPGMTRQLCPNGTYCPVGSRNFTLCPPGFFQPKEGQVNCANCPVGYICPDHGMSRPVVCPPGQICDTQGLRASGKNCPMGHYCLNGTKASAASDFLNNTRDGVNDLWSEEYVTGVVSFDANKVDWSYHQWEFPAIGQSRSNHPPELHCDGMVCSPGSTAVIAEAPFPCPIGHYCRAGVGTQFPLPKNFSTPQRCFDGFFCPRGSMNPEGKGPCPTGYFCPTQLDAIVCPRGHYCPGVGNRGPIECYPGTYNPSERRSNCTVCPTGHVCPGWGSLLPELCPAGFVCSALGLSYPTVLCPAGYICRDGTLTLDPADPTDKKPQPCRAGTFCLGGVSREVEIPWIPFTPWGAQTPQACSEGTYCKSGAYEPSGSGQCFRGHYCPPYLDFPIETPIGNFASEEGSVAPTLCFPGTYAPLKAQVDCLPCPAGHSCQSYGTYIPTICAIGTFRSLVDSVTCRLCITGTYTDEIGAIDISMCLPCPEGRVCGTQGIYNLSTASTCPAGYICGYGTDRTRQFTHKAPAGYHSTAETIPSLQYSSMCSEGFYCVRGTSTALSLRAKCSVGYYCPNGTSTAAGQEVKCPRVTTALSGVNELLDCRISDVDVCDKAAYDLRYPMEDLTYYPRFTYRLLDDSQDVVFSSSATSANPTGEVVVVQKVYAINESSSSPLWVNDTVEAFRTCPSYGSAAPEVENMITVVGRNFLDNGLNFCRWRKCLNASVGSDIFYRRCRNKGTAADESEYPKIGGVGKEVLITRAKYISKTRIQCSVPKFVFEPIEVVPEELKDMCAFINENQIPIGSVSYQEPWLGNLSYYIPCTTEQDCISEEIYRYYTSLVVPCSEEYVNNGFCDDQPEPGKMFNPCVTHEVLVDVTNDGYHYSTGNNLQGVTIEATAVEPQLRTRSFVDYTVPPTFAVFTFIEKEYFPENPDILAMERDHCMLQRYSEEGRREREDAWFLLRAQDVAHIHVDLRHLPGNMKYGEHYRFALFMRPSRCVEELCNANRVRLTPQENAPCKLPATFSNWFMDESVMKNTTNNITVYALEDLIFKFEVHILIGVYAPYAPLFKNCTTVRIAHPSRSRIIDSVKDPRTRRLSPYVSAEERLVTKQYFFNVVYTRSNADSIAYPLNLPPRGEDYQYGRALISYNTSADAVDIPDILDDYDDISIGSKFWDSVASTPSESKEVYDAYFETFHGMTYSDGYYTEMFDQILLPYALFFSNCRTFDSYIPLWLLFEGAECSLPDEEVVGADWPRFDFPALPDQDDVKVVGPWDFMQEPVADWCERTLTCNYEEVLNTLDVVPRWFEASSGDELFSVIREPLTYGQFAGRSGPRIGQKDAGGTAAIDANAAISSDLFKGVVVDREAANDFPGGCTLGCFPRSMLLDIGYYQYDIMEKRLIYINLIYNEFDLDDSDSHYNLDVAYYPLGYFDLLIYFAFDVEIFFILFIFIGGITIAVTAAFWVVVRITTSLQNPPELKLWSMFTLVAPPPSAGVTLALIPVGIITGLAYYLISGDRLQDPAVPVGNWILDEFQLEYVNIDGRLDPADQERARSGRLGIAFCIIGFLCCFVGCKIFLPKKVSKRETELALKRDKMAEKESIWAPTLWKRSNLMFASIMMGVFLVFIVEFSLWGEFGDYIWYVIFMLKVFAKFIDALVDHQLKEALLSAPVQSSLNIIQGLITLGADDFVDFLLSYFVELALLVLERVYIEPSLSDFLDWCSETSEWLIKRIKENIPQFIWKRKKEKEKKDVDYRKRDVDEDVGGDDDAETVEPILDSYSSVCQDTMSVFYTPFLIWLLMQFRTELALPELWGIAEQDMLYYLYFAIVIIFFTIITDIILHSVQELFHGWKIYEYLVYTRYRFLQRETRWKGMELSLDECIDETMRTLDQMCFSSQFYLMLTIHCNGILYITLGMEMMLKSEYNPFSDTALIVIVLYLIGCYIVLEHLIMWFVMKIKLWKIKHENTAWHLQIEDDDDLDVPGWEDVKGASHDAYLMNQRITSETFRYKFLNYNRAWLIQQLPQLLTPRTLRRSRPYLINQFARIINSRRDDISDDSDAGQEKKFGPVALAATSRNIIRFWLDKARRRLRLKHIVEPLIRRARGAECEQCLSRKQLQVLYDMTCC